jgi:hypothetical protein
LISASFSDVWEYRPLLQHAILAFGIVYAFVRGAGPERSVAATFLAMAVAEVTYHGLYPQSPAIVWHFFLDAAAAFAFVWIGLFANRTYTLWIGSFQIIALSAHVVRFLAVGEMLTLPFTILYILPSYFQIGLFLWGTHRHTRRVRRFGPYRSWKSFSHPSWANARLR